MARDWLTSGAGERVKQMLKKAVAEAADGLNKNPVSPSPRPASSGGGCRPPPPPGSPGSRPGSGKKGGGLFGIGRGAGGQKRAVEGAVERASMTRAGDEQSRVATVDANSHRLPEELTATGARALEEQVRRGGGLQGPQVAVLLT
jgi:hypothetical protein